MNISDKIKIDVFMPYNREYFIKTYGPFTNNSIQLIEEEIIPFYITRLQQYHFINNIYIYSNDLCLNMYMHNEHIKTVPRAKKTGNILQRQKLLEVVDSLQLSRFFLLNPLFPLVSLSSLKKIYDIMIRDHQNVILSTTGIVHAHGREIEFGAHLEHGAATAFYDYTSSEPPNAFTDFASLEVLSMRKSKDIELIKIIQDIGMQL